MVICTERADTRRCSPPWILLFWKEWDGCGANTHIKKSQAVQKRCRRLWPIGTIIPQSGTQFRHLFLFLSWRLSAEYARHDQRSRAMAFFYTPTPPPPLMPRQIVFSEFWAHARMPWCRAGACKSRRRACLIYNRVGKKDLMQAKIPYRNGCVSVN